MTPQQIAEAFQAIDAHDDTVEGFVVRPALSRSKAWGVAAFSWADDAGTPVAGTTIWSINSAQGEQFAPSTATFMVNYRVEDLPALVQVLREEGCNVLDKIDDCEYGKFAWVIDPEGNKVELWQPPIGQ